jgi:probable HAF family extracellular repeat protein
MLRSFAHARAAVFVLAAVFVFTTAVAAAESAGSPAFLAVDLGTLGGSTSSANAVNNSGLVVGDSMIAHVADSHAFLWTPAGGMVDLGTLGGTFSSAVAVNTNGQVAGYSTTRDGAWHAFSWTQAGGMVDLGAFAGDYNTGYTSWLTQNRPI